jgi:hypothetical protein
MKKYSKELGIDDVQTLILLCIYWGNRKEPWAKKQKKEVFKYSKNFSHEMVQDFLRDCLIKPVKEPTPHMRFYTDWLFGVGRW